MRVHMGDEWKRVVFCWMYVGRHVHHTADAQQTNIKPTSNQHQQEGLRLSIEVFDGDFSLYSAEGPIKVRMRVGFVGMYV